jgi:hypothetical protein
LLAHSTALLCVLVSTLASSARAQVAIAPIVQADDVVHKDIVGAIALAVAEEHELLSPQLSEKDVALCRDDVECLLRAARLGGASHLVIVSVAPLGARDHVVGVSAYGVRGGEKMYEENAVLSTTRNVRTDAAALGERVAAVEGLPARKESAAPEVPPPSGPGLRTFAGAGMIGGAAVAMVASGVASSVLLAGTNPSPRVVAPIIITGSALTAVLGVGGVVLMILDGGVGSSPDAGADGGE